MALLAPCLAHADIAVLLLEGTGTGAARYTAAGHSALYFSGVCAETPVKLRLCEPGETGAVISNYMDFGEQGEPEWNIAPASLFFYGVESPDDAPLYGDPELLKQLRERYRLRYLKEMCSGDAPCTLGHGNWSDMVAATFVRDIYSFRVKTTREEDAEIVNDFNARQNVNRYSGFRRNCADFTRNVLNRFLPGSARADRWNDFGMTSPKAVARSFSHYGHRLESGEYSVERLAQIPGPLRRSLDNRNGTEVLFRARKWSIPLFIARGHTLAFFAASYYLTAWFNPEREFQRHRGSHAPYSGPAWDRWNARYEVLAATAVRDGLFERSKDIEKYFRVLEAEARTELDANGLPVLSLGHARIGLTRRTIVADDAPSRLLAERVLLARIAASLKGPKKNRLSPEVMAADFKTLEHLIDLRRASSQPTLSSTSDSAPASSSVGPPVRPPAGQ